MTSMNLKEARKHLSAVVNAATRGETTMITRRGKRVARIAPPVKAKRPKLASLADFRATIKVKGKRLSKMVVETRDSERA
jgi:prevent-host-death family protein